MAGIGCPSPLSYLLPLLLFVKRLSGIGMMRAGEADRATVEQAEAVRLAVQNSLHDILRQISETENSLSALLGRMPGSIERGTLDGSGFPQELSVGVPLELLTARPDIRQAEAVLKQRFYMTAQARAAFYPGITLSGSAGWTNNGAAIADPKGWLWQAVGSLVQPCSTRVKPYQPENRKGAAGRGAAVVPADAARRGRRGQRHRDAVADDTHEGRRGPQADRTLATSSGRYPIADAAREYQLPAGTHGTAVAAVGVTRTARRPEDGDTEQDRPLPRAGRRSIACRSMLSRKPLRKNCFANSTTLLQSLRIEEPDRIMIFRTLCYTRILFPRQVARASESADAARR